MLVTERRPTDEQQKIFAAATGTTDNLLINALAGTGKTTTLEMMEGLLNEKRPSPSLYLVFNKKNADEAVSRMPETCTVRTFNALGHRIWQSMFGRLKLDSKKTNILFKEIVEAMPKGDRDVCWELYGQVKQAVGLGKALGYIPESKYTSARRLISRQAFLESLEEQPDDLTADLIDATLKASIDAAHKGFIDFDDQIYMPALFGGAFPRFPRIGVDEAQDLSPTNHAMLDKLLKDGARLTAVGDPWQNIYGFRGAKHGSMSILKEKWKMTELDLSVSFRCPRAIVENARWRVPHFKWIKEGGHVETLGILKLSDIPDNATIICRNNAPLFTLALRLLGARRSVRVVGSDIGPRIVNQLRKLGHDDMTQAEIVSAIDDWLAEKLAKESKVAQEMADCMKVFASFGNTLGTAIGVAEHLFKQAGNISLLTGHKSKGLEFDHVIHIDPDLLKETEQDKNLRYVIQTRSKDRYYEIYSSNIFNESGLV